MTYTLYTIVLAALVAGYAPAAVWRRLTRGVPLRFRARLGRSGERLPGPSAWVHAVSVGEAIAAEPLLLGLRRRYPELPLVMTTVTETGARVVRERFAAIATHRFFPLDFPGALRRTFDAIDPAFLICMETEIWPNTLRAAAARGIPVMIANGRLSDRSFWRYRMVRGLLRPVLDLVRAFAMRSEEDARRMIALGASPERVFVTGNIKGEALADSAGAADLWGRLLGLKPGQRVWIAGSTHRGEEEVVLEAHRAARATAKDLVLVLAPRHPERVPEVLSLVAGRGWPVVRRSQLPAGRDADAVIVLDTVGELAQLYAIADVVFIGGSLVDSGGHNMLEPAVRGKPVLFGPHTSNFREEATLLLASGGARVVESPPALATELERLFGDASLRVAMGTAGAEAVASQRGAVRATLELVARFLRPEAER